MMCINGRNSNFSRHWKKAKIAIYASLYLALATSSLHSEETKQPYDESVADARTYIQQATDQSKNEGKELLIVFGANWCPDCTKLASLFENDLRDYINSRFIVVHIDVGRFNKNIELMESYGLPRRMGIPALVIIQSNGERLSFSKGQFSNARVMSANDVQNLLVTTGETK